MENKATLSPKPYKPLPEHILTYPCPIFLILLYSVLGSSELTTLLNLSIICPSVIVLILLSFSLGFSNAAAAAATLPAGGSSFFCANFSPAACAAACTMLSFGSFFVVCSGFTGGGPTVEFAAAPDPG